MKAYLYTSLFVGIALVLPFLLLGCAHDPPDLTENWESVTGMDTLHFD